MVMAVRECSPEECTLRSLRADAGPRQKRMKGDGETLPFSLLRIATLEKKKKRKEREERQRRRGGGDDGVDTTRLQNRSLPVFHQQPSIADYRLCALCSTNCIEGSS